MRTRNIPVAAVVVVLSAVAGGVFGSQVVATQDRINERYLMYRTALAAIEQNYADKIDPAALVYGSIDGMLRTLDPHSYFLDPRNYKQVRERQEGHYKGIGITIQKLSGGITVTSLFEGSPAYRAGIRRNDVIAKVGVEDAANFETQDVVDRVRGDEGTFVDISIRRPGLDKLIDLTVQRAEIKIVTVRTAFMIAPGTGYVRLQDFSENTNAELTEALTRLQGAGMDRLVLDLRDNPGGPLDQAIAVANQFLPKGASIVSTQGRVPNTNEDYRAVEQGAWTDLPLIVLVNRASASASEIVAGAMQDHDRGLIVGETTFGKALVQGVYTLRNKSGLALTTGRYYTPSGRMIQRPWDGSFDEYLTYSLRDQNGGRDHAPEDARLTTGGRKVYSGGGIEPDRFVPGPVEGFNPSRFSRMLRDRGAFISFAERFTKDGDTRPGSTSAATHKVAPGWQVTDAMVQEFKKFLAAERVRVDEAAFKADSTFIKAMIRFEVDAELFGIEEARRNLSRIDPQAQAALGFFEEARRLLMARR
jgi:carboxyl-terminal processing protease